MTPTTPPANPSAATPPAHPNVPRSGAPDAALYPPADPAERPPSMTTAQAALTGVHLAQAAAEAAAEATEKLLDLVQTSARVSFIEPLSAQRPSRTDVLHPNDPPSRSVGLLVPAGAPLNVGNVAVMLGIAGASVRLGSNVPIVPAGALLVLPVQASDIEIGADATALGANTVTAILLRFETVQPAFYGKAT